MTNASPQPEATPEVDLTDHQQGFERNLFGKWTIRLRNLGGIVATLTTCVAALFNSYTTHISVQGGHGFPGEVSMFIMNIGPILIALTFMNANKTIQTIMQSRGIADKLRMKAAEMIKPAPKPDE